VQVNSSFEFSGDSDRAGRRNAQTGNPWLESKLVGVELLELLGCLGLCSYIAP
jgi:hypothetical protein